MAVALLVVLAALVVPVVFELLRTSLYTQTVTGELANPTLGHYRDSLFDPDFPRLVGTTLVYALGTVVVALALGGSLAWIAERTNAPLGRMTYVMAFAALGIPHLLYSMAWLLVLGKAGPVNQVLGILTGSGSAVFDVHSILGMIVIEGVTWSPFAFLMIAAVLQNADASLEEAARVAGARRWRVLRRVTMRLAVPGVLAVGLLVLVRAVESFDVPLLVGLPGGVHVLSTMIFVDIHANYPPDYGGASAVAVVLLLLVALFLFINRRFTVGKDKYATVGGKPTKRTPGDLGRWRYVATLGTFVYGLVLIVIPGAAIVLTALRKFSGAITFSKSTVTNLTLENFATVLSSSMAVRSGIDSLIVASVAATITILITAVGGWWSTRRRLGGGVIGQLGNFPIIFPSIVLALALLRVFLRVPIPIYATLWALIIAYIVKAVPYGMQYAQVGTVQFKSELEESARTHGAGLARMLRKVVVPLLRPALVSGWLYVFLLTARDLPIALLLYGPDSPVVTTTLYGFWEGGQVVQAAAAGVVWSILLTAVSLGIYLATRRRGGAFRGN